MNTAFKVLHDDVFRVACDILVLKFAQGFYGVDSAVADALEIGEASMRLAIGRTMVVPTDGRPWINVLFLGVEPLHRFGYTAIRRFGKEVLSSIASIRAPRDTLAMTMHGVGYGLDEKEAFTSQLAGLLEYLSDAHQTWRPREILFVEQSATRAERMKTLLEQILKDSGFDKERADHQHVHLPDAGVASDKKPRVFVAMPYDDVMEDVYEQGIKPTVNDAKCLCERCDHAIFTGDILDQIKEQITSATVVIADMTGSNPNVYLEVGYAWGKGIPTLLVAKKGEDLKFDVKTQKCIYYKNITDLKKQLANYMHALVAKP